MNDLVGSQTGDILAAEDDLAAAGGGTVGGMQAFFGPILGAVIVTFISTQVSILTNYYQFILGAIIVFCVLFLQNGLLRDDVTRNLDEPETNKKETAKK